MSRNISSGRGQAFERWGEVLNQEYAHRNRRYDELSFNQTRRHRIEGLRYVP